MNAVKIKNERSNAIRKRENVRDLANFGIMLIKHPGFPGIHAIDTVFSSKKQNRIGVNEKLPTLCIFMWCL